MLILLYNVEILIFKENYDMSEFISPKKAADMLGVSPNTLRNWEISGKLFSIKTMGGHRRYYLKDIENYMKCIEKSVEINAY